MATKFLEPGGDADFLTTNFWVNFNAAVATDFVHGSHVKSIKYRTSNNDDVGTTAGIIADAGTRISVYIYLNALPTTSTATILNIFTSAFSAVIGVKITTGGVLQLFNTGNSTQIGSNGATLSTGVWYRICLAYTLTSTTVNEIRLFKDGVQTISVTNATLTRVGSSRMNLGNEDTNAGLDLRSSDHYIDDSSALTDPGNIWVTAKRPNANGTANNFTVQIGSGGSGYGTGHSPQVNERAQSDTNGWSIVAVAATTEEYNIEAKGTGDIDISTATIVDYVGWVRASSVTSETASIIVNNVSSNISLSNTNTTFTKVAGSSTYPAGTGTDIGVVTDATATTVGLYEAGIMVAYIPAAASGVSTINNLNLLGVG